MKGKGRLVAVTALALTCATPVAAQDIGLVPAPATIAPMPAATADPSITPFYASHPGALIWLADADRQAAAARLVEILNRAPVDGLTEGPELAASVRAALASGLPADDQTISAAWVRYVQALRRPVEGISYGDPERALQAPSASAILSSASIAPSLATQVDQVANVNPFYAVLRDSAVRQGLTDDPHVRASLDRLRLVPGEGRAILVDAANAQLMMIENGQVVDTMKTIVGKAIGPTPLIASTIHYVTFNPYWHIPQDVAKRKVAPVVLKRGVSYLKAARYQTVAAFGGDKEVPIDPESVDWKAVAAGDVEVNIRQLTGPQNMMGAMKFGFANDYGVFLHDTPHKNLFALAKRNLSLGCVRLEHPEKLAAWLLGRDPVPPGDGSEQNVLLDKGVPVYILYLTARPDGQIIAFANDVYKLDGAPSGSAAVVASAKR